MVAEEPAFYEAGWFGLALRYGGAFLALILLLLFGVRPLLKRLKPAAGQKSDDEDAEGDIDPELLIDGAEGTAGTIAGSDGSGGSGPDVAEQVELARQLASSQPDRAAAALQRMLATPAPALASPEAAT